MSPPLTMDAKWFAPHCAYTIAKYGMSMCVLGQSAEFAKYKIAVNALWPKTTIATAAVANLLGGDESMRRSRTADIVADAAYVILTKPPTVTGQFFIDEVVLRDHGVTDFSAYRADKSQKDDSHLLPDYFL